jgi:hypothetical protein
MRRTRTKRVTSLVGLTVADGRLRASHVTRNKSGLAVAKTATADLTLDLLHPEAELVGREIRNHLDAAGIRERQCVVALPPAWVLSQQVRVPDLSAEDATAFLQLEAEKGFPCDPEQLLILPSPQTAGGANFVTQLAVRREQLDQLAAVFKAAGLRPLGYTIGLTALPGVITSGDEGRITLSLGRKDATLIVSAGGGIAAFRTFDTAINSEAGENVLNSRAIGRELRITFEQIPAELRRQLRTLTITGEADAVRKVEGALAGWAREAALRIEAGSPERGEVADQIAERIAGQTLESAGIAFNFLPPRPNRWVQLVARYNSRRLASTGFAAAAVVLLVLAAFGWQEFQRWSLRNQWEDMKDQVAALEVVQNRIRDYRPWYDTSFRNLTILRRVTDCFPDNGSVTAKSFEIHGSVTPTVSVTGTARDNTALLKTTDDLRKTKEVQGLKIEQIRGKAPQQFTFTFRWNANSPTP